MIRTGYSFKSAAGHLHEVIDRLVEVDSVYAPIADSGNTFGFVKWRNAAKTAGLKPVYGVRIPVCISIQAKKPVYCEFVFIAKDSLRPLNELVTLATSQFRYRPNLTYQQMMDAKGVYRIAGHTAQFDLFEPQEDLFIGLSVATAKGYYREAVKRGYQFCAMQENKFPLPEDSALYEAVCGRWADLKTYRQHILSKEEWFSLDVSSSEDKTAAWDNYLRIMEDASKVELPQGEMVVPITDKTLRQVCEEGAIRLGVNLQEPRYKERLDYELDIIAQKNFEPYFHVVGDMTTFARKNMLVGPGRGSSAGSLVCWLTGITSVNPLDYDLMFERFLSLDRMEMPDCDVDFDSDNRDLVFDYMANKYGRDHVSRLGSVGTFKEDAAMNEAGKALGVTPFECKFVLSKAPTYAAGDEAAAKEALRYALNDTPEGQAFLKKHPYMAVAQRMVGHPRNGTQHAAGIIVTKAPVSDYVAVDSRTHSTMFNKTDAEELDTLKIDALGLRQLAIFQMALDLAGLPSNHLDTLKLDDQEVFDVLNEGRMCGLFQFSGRALANLTSQVHVSSLEDMIALTSLARPGPAQSGATAEWVARKNGKRPVTYAHPSFEPYLKNSLGILCYQEGILGIARGVGGMSWPDVSALRRAVSKSKGRDALAKYEAAFKDGAKSNGVPEEVSDRFWSELLAFGKYGFVRAHAAAYSVISYWSCYLKRHYPLEFSAATLTYQDDSDQQLTMLRELAKENIHYLPVDAELSTDRWTVGWKDGKKVLVAPLSAVNGIGPKVVQQILSARARNEPLPDRAAKLLAKAETKIDNLWPIAEAIKGIDLVAKGILTKPTPISECNATGEWEEDRVVIGVVTVCKERDENEPARIEDRIANGREGRMSGKTAYLEMRVTDDSGTLLCKLGRNDFEPLGPQLLDKIKEGKTIIACKGTCPPEISMLLVKQARIIGAIK